MYKNMRNLLIGVVFLAVSLIVVMVYVINNSAFNNYNDLFIGEKKSQIDYYLENNFSDLYDVIVSHAVWTESRDKIINWDEDWLYENATGYLIDDEVFNLDYMYVSNENQENFSEYGSINLGDVRELDVYVKTLKENVVTKTVIWNDNKPILLMSSPFFTNEFEKPTGCFLVARVLDKDEIYELGNIVSWNTIKEISFVNSGIESVERFDNQTLILELPIDEENNISVRIVFRLEFWEDIFMKEKYFIIGFIIIIAIICVVILSRNYKIISTKLKEVVEGVKMISDGNYHIKVKESNDVFFPELGLLVTSVNKMSKDVENNMTLIENHVKAIDNKYFEMIELLVKVVEMNDKYTYHHSVAVADYSVLIGNAIGFSDIKNLELAAKLHDVGKVSIPSHILNKPGKLDEDEYELIMTHAEEGYKLLNDIDSFCVAKYGVLFHHERYDGTGYPNRIKGQDIPIIAQIISIADVFDALTSDRSYRKAMSFDKAMEIIQNESGKMFNPILVEAFCSEMKKVGKVR